MDRGSDTVLEDVVESRISTVAARDLYGVVIVDGVVDEAATKAERSRRKHRKGSG